jgi:hypothetical protein
MNKEQQELLDEAYVNYGQKIISEDLWMLVAIGWTSNQEEFIDKCKTDTEFSQKWGLKIEERELSLEERAKWLEDTKGYDLLVGNLDHDHIREVVEEEAPTKLITITYNNKTIESYE